MVKKLPQVKKGLKEFILDEDAKVIDKSATKIAITLTFISVNFMLNAEDANAKGHHDHSDHSNNLNAPNNYGTGIHGGTNPMQNNVNEIPEKSVETMHSNHYNHQDAEGGQGMMMTMLVVVAVACVALGPYMGVIGTQLWGAGLASEAAVTAGANAFVGAVAAGNAAGAVAAGTAAAAAAAAGTGTAIAAGAATVIVGSAAVGGVAGAMMEGSDGGGDIDTGNAHFVPEPVLRALEEEEEN